MNTEKKKEYDRNYNQRTGYARQNEYNKKNIKQIILKFNIVNDKDVLEKLDDVSNKTDYVRQLIINDINGSVDK